MESHPSPRQAILLVIAGLRSLLNPDLYPLHPQQSDIRRRSLHRYWTWFRHHKNLFQHSVLSFRRAKYLPWHEDPHHAALRDADAVDAIPHLLLGDDPLIVHRAFLVQPSPICLLRLHHRL